MVTKSKVRGKKMELTYTVDAFNVTAENACLDFAETFFEKPREITKIVNNQFSFIDGYAIYEIQFRPGKRFETRDTWEIWKLS